MLKNKRQTKKAKKTKTKTKLRKLYRNNLRTLIRPENYTHRSTCRSSQKQWMNEIKWTLENWTRSRLLQLQTPFSRWQQTRCSANDAKRTLKMHTIFYFMQKSSNAKQHARNETLQLDTANRWKISRAIYVSQYAQIWFRCAILTFARVLSSQKWSLTTTISVENWRQIEMFSNDSNSKRTNDISNEWIGFAFWCNLDMQTLQTRESHAGTTTQRAHERILPEMFRLMCGDQREIKWKWWTYGE